MKKREEKQKRIIFYEHAFIGHGVNKEPIELSESEIDNAAASGVLHLDNGAAIPWRRIYYIKLFSEKELE